MALDERSAGKGHDVPVRVGNPDGAGPYLFVCEHASNHLPRRFGTLGLAPSDLVRHIAWDPGALPVARRLSEILDSPLVESCISRLVIDCNRPLDAPDLVPETSELTVIPGNAGLSAAGRAERVAVSYAPFHDTLSDVIDRRLAAGLETRIVTIHTFTPVYKGQPRPWQIGIIHDEDERLAGPMISALRRDKHLCVGVNQPYSPADRVYFTLERHARSRGLACAMIEIRNDEVSGEAGQRIWAERLAGILRGLEQQQSHTGGERPAQHANS